LNSLQQKIQLQEQVRQEQLNYQKKIRQGIVSLENWWGECGDYIGSRNIGDTGLVSE
jgi:hypothetical protein